MPSHPIQSAFSASSTRRRSSRTPRDIVALPTTDERSATDVDATTVEFPDQCARVDVCLALNCDVGFTVDSALQAVVFDNGLHDPRLSHDAIPRALLEQISAPFVALLPLQTDAVGPLGVCVSVAPLAGFANLLVLLNVHTVKGRPSLQLGAAHATIKFALDRLVKNMQRRHPHIFVPKRILQVQSVIVVSCIAHSLGSRRDSSSGSRDDSHHKSEPQPRLSGCVSPYEAPSQTHCRRRRVYATTEVGSRRGCQGVPRHSPREFTARQRRSGGGRAARRRLRA